MNSRSLSLIPFLLLPLLCLPVPAPAQSGIEAVFDLPVIAKDPIDAARFEEFFPARFLEINVSKPEEDADEILKEIRKDTLSKLSPELIPPEGDYLPLPYFFSSYLVAHDRKDRLEEVMFSESTLPLRRSRVLRLYRLLEEAIGPSDSVHGRKRPGVPTVINVTWQRPQGRLILVLEADDRTYYGCSIRLDYYPEESPRLKYLNRVKTTPVQLGDSTAETVEAFLNHHAAFREGDGPFPPTPLADTLEERLVQYGATVGLKDSLSFRTCQRLNELHRRLEPALEQEFSAHPVPERYQRILDLAIQSRKGESQVGAAAFLAHYEDPATQPYLRRGLEVGLPSGVSSYSARGLARFCTGDLLRQTVEDFLLDKGHAFEILRHLPTRKQVGELWKIRNQTPDASNQQRLDGVLTLAERNLE